MKVGICTDYSLIPWSSTSCKGDNWSAGHEITRHL